MNDSQSETTKPIEPHRQDYGRDYERAKRIIDRYGSGSTLTPEELAAWIREAREFGYGD